MSRDSHHDKKSSEGSEDGEIKETVSRDRGKEKVDYEYRESTSMSHRHRDSSRHDRDDDRRRHRRGYHHESDYRRDDDRRYDESRSRYKDDRHEYDRRDDVYTSSSSHRRHEDRDRKRHKRHHRDDRTDDTGHYSSPNVRSDDRHRDREGRHRRHRDYDSKTVEEDLRRKIGKRHLLDDDSSRDEGGSRRSTPMAVSSAPATPASAKKDPHKTRNVTGYGEVHDVEMSGDEDCQEVKITPVVTPEEDDRTPVGDEGPILGPEPPSPPQESDDETEQPFIPYYPAIEGCRSVEEFSCLNRIEEGTYGVVYRAECKKTHEIVALKRLKMEKEKEGFPITSLREINTLMKSPHENIVRVKEIVVGSNMDKIFIVMEYVEHDLKSLMDTMKKPFLLGEVKTLLMQLLSAISHLHDNWILHRDLKTSNLLLSHRGILKVGDFGLAREYGSPLKAYTPVVVTLWYRAPELLLESPKYSTPIDVWSIGCIFGELLTMKPFFPGKSEVDQLNLIFRDLGTPNEKVWPGYSDLPVVKKVTFVNQPYNLLSQRLGNKLNKTGLDLMMRFLAYCPERRMTAASALHHDFFSESPLPVDTWAFPTWPAKSEGSARPKVHSPKAPVGGGFADREAGDNDDILMGGYRGPGFSLKF